MEAAGRESFVRPIDIYFLDYSQGEARSSSDTAGWLAPL